MSSLQSSHASRKRLTWAILSVSLLVAETQTAYDTTVAANLQPTIIAALKEVSKFPWINVTYSLANGSSCLLWAKYYKFFDTKLTFILARLLFAAGSALSASTTSMNLFIVGRAITGIGGGGTYIGAIAIITMMTASEERAKYYGYIGFSWGFGAIIGPIISGAFTASKGGWRWSFYLDVILAGATLPVFIFSLPSSRSQRHPHLPQHFLGRLRRIDFCGSLLFAGSLVSGVMALSFAGIVYNWTDARIIGLFCCSGTLWLCFGIQQATATLTTEDDRILPISILRSLETWTLLLEVACPISCLFMVIYYTPLYLQFVRAETAIRSATDMLPFLIPFVFFMLASGRLISIGWYKIWVITGSTLAVISSVLLYKADVGTSHGLLYFYLIISGAGIGLYIMNSGPVMAAKAPPHLVAEASTIFGCTDTISGVVAVAIANNIFYNRATSGIAPLLPHVPRATLQAAITGVGSSVFSTLSEPTKQRLLQTVLGAIKDVWVQLIVTASVSFVLSLLLKRETLGHLTREAGAEGGSESQAVEMK